MIIPIIIKKLDSLAEKKTISQLLILTSFLITFTCIRITTHLQRAHILGNQNGPLHIHHMVPGIILLLISGFIGISFWSNDKVKHTMAVLFGIGAGLTIDEFALWLFLKDVYWTKQGRDSIDAVIIVTVLIACSLLLTEIDITEWIKRKIKK